jgi:hypothetical protein
LFNPIEYHSILLATLTDDDGEVGELSFEDVACLGGNVLLGHPYKLEVVPLAIGISSDSGFDLILTE